MEHWFLLRLPVSSGAGWEVEQGAFQSHEYNGGGHYLNYCVRLGDLTPPVGDNSLMEGTLALMFDGLELRLELGGCRLARASWPSRLECA